MSLAPPSLLLLLLLSLSLSLALFLSLTNARNGFGDTYADVLYIAGHSGNAHQTSRNAVTMLSKAVLQLSALTDYDNSVTVNVGTFNGGTTGARVQ